MLQRISEIFQSLVTRIPYCSLRFVRERHEVLNVRQDVPEPVQQREDTGVMITVVEGSGLGYGATADLSREGIQKAFEHARFWARKTSGLSVVDFSSVRWPHRRGEYVGPEGLPWRSVSLKDKFDLLRKQCERMKISDAIVDRQAGLWHIASETLLLTNQGGRIFQRFSFVVPSLSATANRGPNTQTRTFGGLRENCRQGGLEVLEDLAFTEQPARIAREALLLLDAPDCPEGRFDLLLAPDQMILQIHESIGHPLELDRILGDERNYAGTSFVTLEMIGSYRYGSDLLNVTFDPENPYQFASYGFDDEGLPAEKVFIIEHGILKAALGGVLSQARSGKPGVANSRAAGWNRPPIDRMANLNLEPGSSTFEQMVRSVERGIFASTNRSWSIDDSRNKFQFGCEWGQLIEDGELTTVVKNPNYRGISAVFWRNLKAVGDRSTLRYMGTPFCGKGEPNQMIRVGHASPACLFADVEVFGGA